MNTFHRLTLWTAAVLSVASLSAQTLAPMGGEFPLHPPRNGDQTHPVLDLSASGGILVWEDNGMDADGSGIAACFLDASFNAASGVMQVNAYTQGTQQHPQVALLPQGGALITWEGFLPGRRRTPPKNESFMRVLVNGRNRGRETALTPRDARLRYYTVTNRMSWYKNTYRPRTWKLRNYVYESRRDLADPQPAVLPDGSLLVVYTGVRTLRTNTYEFVTQITSRYRRGYWYYYTNDVAKPVSYGGSWKQDVMFQRFDNRRYRRLGQEVTVNQFVDNNQNQPSLAVLSDGRFVIVWLSETFIDESSAAGSIVQIKGRIFSSQGEPLTDEFLVNPEPLFVGHPDVAARADGGFTVVWNQQDVVRSNRWDIFARAFESDGTSSQDAYRVNGTTFGDQFEPSVASAGSNDLVVWTSLGQDGSREGVYGRLLSVGGTVGDEFRINTTTHNMQRHPAVGSDGGERFLVAWSGFNGASSLDLAAQTYRSTQPLAAPGAPAVVAVSDTTLELSWSDLSSPELAGYEVYVDDLALPHLVAGTTTYLQGGLTAQSSHTFKLAYVLNDGRRSLLSDPASGTTLATEVVQVEPEPVPPEPPVVPVEPEPAGEEVGTPATQDTTGPASLVFRAQLTRVQSGLELRWNTAAGRTYQVQVSDNLERWMDLGDSRVAAGATDMIAVSPKEEALWFRIVELP